MKILRLNKHHLRNEEHFQFQTDVKTLIESLDAEQLKISSLFEHFLEVYLKEDEALEKIRKSLLTDPITDLDRKRDELFMNFKQLVKSHFSHFQTEKAEAARKIQTLIDHYGNITKKSYNETTASVYNFIQDIEASFSNELQTLNAKDWIVQLKSFNNEFEELMNERHDEKAKNQSSNLRFIRDEVDNIYLSITEKIEALSLLHNDEGIYSDFIARLNARIEYYKHTLTHRKSKVKK